MNKNKIILLKYCGLSNEVFEILRFELNMLFLRINNKINPFKIQKINNLAKSNNILLNIGAGPFGEAGWINIDMFMYKNISFTFDCRKKIPFRDNSVSLIRCEHVLEHMDKQFEALVFLKECVRILKPRGIIRIIVPDIEKFITAYYEKKWEKVGINYEFSPYWSEADVMTHIFRQSGEHKYGYDFKSLTYLLQEAGFQTIYKTEFGSSKDNKLTNDQPNHQWHSLYAEAIKK